MGKMKERYHEELNNEMDTGFPVEYEQDLNQVLTEQVIKRAKEDTVFWASLVRQLLSLH